MTATYISVASLVVAIIVAVSNIRRSDKSENRSEASEMTTLIVKLENISDGINEIKSDMRNMRSDIQELRDRLIKVEESCKQAHHRIDGMEHRSMSNDN